MEDVQKTTVEDLLGETTPEPEEPKAEPEEPKAEETLAEKRARLKADFDAAEARVNECQRAFVEAKNALREAGKELTSIKETEPPLHELNRVAKEATRAEFEDKLKAAELLSTLTNRRPSPPSRPPMFSTGDRQRRE